MGLGVVLRLEETACTLRGNWCMSSRKKGRRTARNSWRWLRSTWKRTTRSTLAWISSTRSGECCFSSGKICARANGPPERKPPLRESTRKSGALDAEGGAPSPSTGLVCWGEMLQKTNCGKRGKQERTNKKKKRTKKGRKENWSLSNLFQLGLLAVLE